MLMMYIHEIDIYALLLNEFSFDLNYNFNA